jgi:hypothetical protein
MSAVDISDPQGSLQHALPENTGGSSSSGADLAQQQRNFSALMDPNGRFGTSVGWVGGSLWVGAPGSGGHANQILSGLSGGGSFSASPFLPASSPAGSLYQFALGETGAASNFSYFGNGSLPGLNLKAGDRFGASVAGSSDTVVVPRAGSSEQVEDSSSSSSSNNNNASSFHVVAIGSPNDDDAGVDSGALYFMFVPAEAGTNATSTAAVTSVIKVGSGGSSSSSSSSGGGVHLLLPFSLGPGDLFGASVCSLGDLNADLPHRFGEWAIGAPGDGEGGDWAGAVYVVFPRYSTDKNGVPTVVLSRDFIKVWGIGNGDGGGVITCLCYRPYMCAWCVFCVRMYIFNYLGGECVYVCVFFFFTFLLTLLNNPHPNLKKIGTRSQGQPPLGVGAQDRLGTSLASMGDLNGDGIPDLAAGAVRHDSVFRNGSTIMNYDDAGSVVVLMMGNNEDAVWAGFEDNVTVSVKSTVKLGPTSGGLPPGVKLASKDFFGSSVAALGDIDGNY